MAIVHSTPPCRVKCLDNGQIQYQPGCDVTKEILTWRFLQKQHQVDILYQTEHDNVLAHENSWAYLASIYQ